MSFDPDITYRRLSRFWNERNMNLLEDAMMGQDKAAERRAASVLNWFPEHARPVRAALARVASAFPGDDRERIPDSAWSAIETHLGEVLDLTPPGDKARQVFRPMWPMTLDQLRAMAQEAHRG